MVENKMHTAIGKVVGIKMNKTITVVVERKEKHPLYGKFIRRSTKLHAHDENNECHVGDIVKVVGTRPHSKSKTWSLIQLIEKAVV